MSVHRSNSKGYCQSAEITIRPATIADEEAMICLHEGVWQEIHRGLTPAQIDGSSKSERKTWPAGNGTWLVAEHDGEIIGFGIGGPTQDALLHADAEIQGIYVRRKFRFRGVGSHLASALAYRLSHYGAHCMGTWVSAMNVAAISFARALGAAVERRKVAHQAIEDGSLLNGHPRIALVWDDINALAAQASPHDVRSLS